MAAYLAETKNALDPKPVSWWAAVNDPKTPLLPAGFDNNYTAGGTMGGDLDEIVQVKYAPNGDIWASFLTEMCPSLNTASCSWDHAAHANSFWQGALGRLTHRRAAQQDDAQ